MRKRKKAVVLFLVCVLLLTGCAQKDVKKNLAEDGRQAEPAGGNIDQMTAADTNILQDLQDGQLSEGETMLLERDFPLPDAVGSGETMLSVLLNGRWGIEVFSHRQADEFYRYTFKDGDWKKQKLQLPEQVKESAGLNRAEVVYGEDGRYYVFYALSDESNHLLATDDLKAFEDVTPVEWARAQDPRLAVIPEKVRVSADGILCAYIMHDNVCRFYDLNHGGDVIGEIEAGSPYGMEIGGNYIFNRQDNGSSYYIYDIKKQKTVIETDRNLTGNTVYEIQSPEKVYAANENGIYQLIDEKWKMLADSSLNSLSDPTLARRSMQHMDGRIYVLYLPMQSVMDAREKEGTPVVKYYEYGTDIPKVNATMTIWGLEEQETVKRTLAFFRKEHPDVRVIYETASDANGAATKQDIIRQFNAKLYAGNGPDLIVLDGLPQNAYMEKGLLYDFDGEMEEWKEELIPAVCQMTEENPYAVPLRIAVPLTSAKKDVNLDCSLEKFLRGSAKIRTPEMTAEQLAGVCYHFFSEGIVLNGEGVDKEDIAGFLKLCREASEKWMLNEEHLYMFDYEDGGGDTDVLRGKADVNFSYAYGLNQIWMFLDAAEQTGMECRIVENRFYPREMLAVNKDSSNKELAAAFIKMALGRKIQEQDARVEKGDGFPVNEAALDAWNGHKSNFQYAGVFEGVETASQWPSEGLIKRFLEDVKHADKATWRNDYVQELVMKAAVDVIHGQEDADAAAGRIMNQLELYYDE